MKVTNQSELKKISTVADFDRLQNERLPSFAAIASDLNLPMYLSELEAGLEASNAIVHKAYDPDTSRKGRALLIDLLIPCLPNKKANPYYQQYQVNCAAIGEVYLAILVVCTSVDEVENLYTRFLKLAQVRDDDIDSIHRRNPLTNSSGNQSGRESNILLKSLAQRAAYRNSDKEQALLDWFETNVAVHMRLIVENYNPENSHESQSTLLYSKLDASFRALSLGSFRLKEYKTSLQKYTKLVLPHPAHNKLARQYSLPGSSFVLNKESWKNTLLAYAICNDISFTEKHIEIVLEHSRNRSRANMRAARGISQQ
jgi:hypothetical protein